MLRNVQMTVMVILLIAAAACSLYERDVEVPQEFTFNLEQPANTVSAFMVTEQVEVGLGEVNKNNKKVKELVINKITLKVNGCAGDFTSLLSGKLQFAPTGSSDYRYLGMLQTVNLRELETSGKEVPIEGRSAYAVQELVTLIRGGDKVNFKLEGIASGGVVAATLGIKIYTSMKIDI